MKVLMNRVATKYSTLLTKWKLLMGKNAYFLFIPKKAQFHFVMYAKFDSIYEKHISQKLHS